MSAPLTREKVLSMVDHTLLGVDSTWEQIKGICDDGMKYKTASVCIPPRFVKQAKEYVGDKLAICTVIGFPQRRGRDRYGHLRVGRQVEAL